MTETENTRSEMVVVELPQITARVARGEDGKMYDLLTLAEAVQDIRESMKVLLERTKK